MVLRMTNSHDSIFERNPKVTVGIILSFMITCLWGICSLKILNNQWTEFENKSIKTLVHQYYVGKIIDNNIGRFIKLREHRPNQEKFERPSRNYLKNIAPNTIERRYYRVKIDQHGFIEPSAVHEIPELKIVFLGGSTTECLYMQEEQRFPYLVGRNLEKTLKKRVNSYNGGVSANESMHSINILLNKILPLKPNIVVLMHNINDLVILRSQGSYGYPHSLKSHVQTSKNVFTRYEFPSNPQAAQEKTLLEEFERNLKTFIAICQIRKIQPILMTQANRVMDDPLYHRFNQRIREVGMNEKVLVIDLAKKIPPTTEYLYDSYHYTAMGAALAAQVIAESVAINKVN